VASVRELGGRLTDSWRRRGFREGDFADLAVSALEPLAAWAGDVDPSDLICWIAGAPDLTRQVPKDPAVILYQNDRLDIGLLFSMPGLALAHDHAFTGAALVLAGTGAQLRYSFACARQVNERLRVGHLSVAGVDLVQPGQVRALPCTPFIHAMIPLDSPIVVLLVKAALNDRHRFNYWEPGIALREETAERATRCLQIANMLLKLDDSANDPILIDMAAAPDADISLRLLLLATGRMAEERFARLVEAAARAHPPVPAAMLHDLVRAAVDRALVRRKFDAGRDAGSRLAALAGLEGASALPWPSAG
jgi:hypothetical protein